MKLFVLAHVWLSCGFLAYGLMYHNLINQCLPITWKSRYAKAGVSAMYLILGPVGILMAFPLLDSYGLRYSPPTYDECARAFAEQYPTLNYEKFLSQ